MNTTDCIQQIHTEHLQDHNTFTPLTESPTVLQLSQETLTLSSTFYTHSTTLTVHSILPPTTDFNTHTHFLRQPTNTNLTYFLDQFHLLLKDQLATYPNTSCTSCNHQPPLTPSYIQDSATFKRYLDAIPPLPNHTYLCTADITSLYTNIPIQEGIQLTCSFIDTHRHASPSYAPNTRWSESTILFWSGHLS